MLDHSRMDANIEPRAIEPILLSREQAANLLNLSPRAIDHLVRQGRLASKKFGRRRLIPRAALEALARQGCARIAPPEGERK